MSHHSPAPSRDPGGLSLHWRTRTSSPVGTTKKETPKFQIGCPRQAPHVASQAWSHGHDAASPRAWSPVCHAEACLPRCAAGKKPQKWAETMATSTQEHHDCSIRVVPTTPSVRRCMRVRDIGRHSGLGWHHWTLRRIASLALFPSSRVHTCVQSPGFDSATHRLVGRAASADCGIRTAPPV